MKAGRQQAPDLKIDSKFAREFWLKNGHISDVDVASWSENVAPHVVNSHLRTLPYLDKNVEAKVKIEMARYFVLNPHYADNVRARDSKLADELRALRGGLYTAFPEHYIYEETREEPNSSM